MIVIVYKGVVPESILDYAYSLLFSGGVVLLPGVLSLLLLMMLIYMMIYIYPISP